MLENEKKWEKKRLEQIEKRKKEEKELEKYVNYFNRTSEGIAFDFEKIGLDKNNNKSPSQFIKDAKYVSEYITTLKGMDETKSNSKDYASVYKLDQELTSSVSFLSYIDEDGYWKDGDIASAEDMMRYYENASPKVKEIVDAYLSDDQ